MNNVQVVVGDLFKSNAQTLTNTVNTVGVMGKGISLEFRQRFTDMYDDYVHRCEQDLVRLGEPYLFRPLIPPWILNFPTKEHWRSRSTLDAICRGLQWLVDHYESWGIESLAIPPLGCGEGGLEWRIVGPTLYQGLSQLDIPVLLYAPFETPHEELQPLFLGSAYSSAPPTSRVPASAVAIAVIVDSITQWQHSYPIGRISFQKIAYFATKAGIPTKLQFERRSFGPFSEDIKRLQTSMINNGLISEQKQGQMYITNPGPTLTDARQVFAEELHGWESQIERIVDLFLRLPSSRFIELAATVHDVAISLSHRSRSHGNDEVAISELLDAVRAWKARRNPPFREDEILSAIETLEYLGWIEVARSYDRLHTA